MFKARDAKTRQRKFHVWFRVKDFALNLLVINIFSMLLLVQKADLC